MLLLMFTVSNMGADEDDPEDDDDDEAMDDVDDEETGCGMREMGIGIEERLLVFDENSVNSL